MAELQEFAAEKAGITVMRHHFVPQFLLRNWAPNGRFVSYYFPSDRWCWSGSAGELHSLATLASRTMLPASSTMQTLVSLTDTSSPAKWSMLRFSF
jgi:hypothetical protein